MTPATRTARAAAGPALVLLVIVPVVTLLSGCQPSLDGLGVGSTSAPSTPGRSIGVPSPAVPATKSATIGGSATYVFPVHSKAATFGRIHHDYPATDIFAPCGTPVLAATAGVVSEVSREDLWTSRRNGGAVRGGLSVSIVGTDGVRYYGSHLRSIAKPIVPGYRVAAGERLGELGNTGDARGIACHLHFGISPACGKGDWWIRRGAVSPYPFVKAWQASGKRSDSSASSASPVKDVAAWRAEHGCPKSAGAPR